MGSSSFGSSPAKRTIGADLDMEAEAVRTPKEGVAGANADAVDAQKMMAMESFIVLIDLI